MAARTFSMTLRLTFPTSFPVDPLMFLSAFVMTTTYLAPFRRTAEGGQVRGGHDK